MNKIPCDIIQDLLPLYVDNVCSERSKKMIEEHLAECNDCLKYHKSLTEDLPPVTDSEVEFIKKIKQKLTIQKFIFCGVFLAIAFLFFAISENPTQNPALENVSLFDKRIAVEDIEISEVCQLENGNVYFTLTSDTPFTIRTYQTISPSDDTEYKDSYENGYNFVSVRRSRWEELFGQAETDTQVSFVVPLTETYEGATHKSVHLYYEGKNDETITIWEKGDHLEKAPDWIEEQVKNQDKIIIQDNVVESFE